MSNNYRAERIIANRILNEIQERLNTYNKYAGSTTAGDMGLAITAKQNIEEWAISDITFLLKECKQLQNDICFYRTRLDDISPSHSCNDCGIQSRCFLAPEWGDVVRHKCVFWEEIKPKTLD